MVLTNMFPESGSVPCRSNAWYTSASVVDPKYGIAHRMKGTRAVCRIDGHNVGVLELGQRVRLAREFTRDFQRDKTMGQLRLPGQEYPAEGPAT